MPGVGAFGLELIARVITALPESLPVQLKSRSLHDDEIPRMRPEAYGRPIVHEIMRAAHGT